MIVDIAALFALEWVDSGWTFATKAAAVGVGAVLMAVGFLLHGVVLIVCVASATAAVQPIERMNERIKTWRVGVPIIVGLLAFLDLFRRGMPLVVVVATVGGVLVGSAWREAPSTAQPS